MFDYSHQTKWLLIFYRLQNLVLEFHLSKLINALKLQLKNIIYLMHGRKTINKPIVFFDFWLYADGYFFIQFSFHHPFIFVQYDKKLLTYLTNDFTSLKSFLRTVVN